ncbi:MAG: hypothetical protein ACTSVB_09260 [Candidatus Heimdallarchaeaceae archaeon]
MQKIFGLGMGATGIVGTLVVVGILLKATDLASTTGDLAIMSGVGIGIILGLLGIFGVLKRLIG